MRPSNLRGRGVLTSRVDFVTYNWSHLDNSSALLLLVLFHLRKMQETFISTADKLRMSQPEIPAALEQELSVSNIGSSPARLAYRNRLLRALHGLWVEVSKTFLQRGANILVLQKQTKERRIVPLNALYTEHMILNQLLTQMYKL